MRAAIYSRKSKFTGKGDSIGNQIQLCKEYADIHLREFNISEFFIYEDEGFSGGTLNRPEFKKLQEDVKLKKFNMLICYRLDRISRNVADFSAILNFLEHYNIIFISIREQFDTSTPMGKAMAYISSVFAQLERETISERIRDNMLEMAKSGRWLGGQTPLGFKSKKISYLDKEYRENSMYKLTPLKDEQEKVQLIFSKYVESKSIHKVLKYLLTNNIKGKKGGEFSAMTIKDILRNPVYVKSSVEVFRYLNQKGIQTWGTPNGNGILIYNKKTSTWRDKDVTEWIAAPGGHKGIMFFEDWLKVQKTLDLNSKKISPRLGTSKRALLTGILKCSCGAPMRVIYGKNNIYYYTCTMKCSSGGKRCNNRNVRGDILENIIIKSIPKTDISLIIKELKLKSNKKTSKSIIKDKENQLNRLICNIEKSQNQKVNDEIMSRVNSLSLEIEKLESSKNKVFSLPLTFLDLNIIIEQHENPTLRKRIALEDLIEKIIWDGWENKVKIYLKGA